MALWLFSLSLQLFLQIITEPLGLYSGSISVKGKLFINSYKSKYGRIPSEFAVQGYDSGKVIIEALKSLSGDISNKDDLAEAIRTVSIVGPRGPLTIDKNTNNVIQNK